MSDNEFDVVRQYFANEISQDEYAAYSVYFISDGTYIKIGVSDSVADRMRMLQTGNARQLSLLYVLPCLSRESAFHIERELHYRYRNMRKCGEWFDIAHLYSQTNYTQIPLKAKHNTGGEKTDTRIAVYLSDKTTTCVLDVWVNCFKRTGRRPNKNESLFIGKEIDKVSGWKKSGASIRFPKLGKQRYWYKEE